MMFGTKLLFIVYTSGLFTEGTDIFVFEKAWAAGKKLKEMNASTPYVWELAIF